MKFLLDTNTCIYAIKKYGDVIEAMSAVNPDVIAVSVVSEAELRTGAAKSTAPMRNLHTLEIFLAPLTIVDFTSQDTIAYAQVRAKLERAGTPIGALDLIIAAQALTRDLTLVTNNEREFRRVSGLRVENWRG
jgi:tRNA(fMet)-specific endonuclease VapC